MMKISGYMLMSADLEYYKEAPEKLRDISGIESAHALYGAYDVIATFSVEENKFTNLRKQIIKNVPGIRRIDTNIKA